MQQRTPNNNLYRLTALLIMGKMGGAKDRRMLARKDYKPTALCRCSLLFTLSVAKYIRRA
ncbi:MAG: hypothetical protein CMC15_13815 [Flavobacteriaceae bacterium]|nr:hypothetical protein [Flavobacteriaceae bacterium]